MKKMNLMIVVVLLLSVLSSPSVFGAVEDCRFNYFPTANVSVTDFIEDEGLGADCNASLYVDGDLVVTKDTVRQGLSYSVNFSGVDENFKNVAKITCDKAGTGYFGTCDLTPDADRENNLLAIIIFQILAVLVFAAIAVGHSNSWVKLTTAFFASIEFIFGLGLIYVNQRLGDISALLKVNFYIMAIVGFGVVMITMFTKSFEAADYEEVAQNTFDSSIRLGGGSGGGGGSPAQGKWGKESWKG